MREAVYILCAATAFTCAAMLFRSYQRTKLRLLLWSCLCFVLLTVNNVLLYVDLVVTGPSVDLALPRAVSALLGVSLLLYGLVWEGSSR
jgi:uncharacterized protein DUF5985